MSATLFLREVSSDGQEDACLFRDAANDDRSGYRYETFIKRLLDKANYWTYC